MPLNLASPGILVREVDLTSGRIDPTTDKIGAIVALEPSSGEILALISAPTYNPNLLIGRKRSDNYKILSEDKKKPLFNRAIQGTYPPGSTFKLINGLIALQAGSITKYTNISCKNNGYS